MGTPNYNWMVLVIKLSWKDILKSDRLYGPTLDIIWAKALDIIEDNIQNWVKLNPVQLSEKMEEELKSAKMLDPDGAPVDDGFIMEWFSVSWDNFYDNFIRPEYVKAGKDW